MTATDHNNALIASYYEAHRADLLRFVECRLGCADVAEDIVQNVFLRLLSGVQVVTEVTLPSLVYTTARNLITDHWRHTHHVEQYEHFVAHQYGGVMATSEGPESVYSAIEVSEALERGMARLSRKQQDVYRLSVYDGMKVADISRQLQLGYKCVEQRLGVARKEVRAYVSRELKLA